MTRLLPGDRAPELDLRTITGAPAPLPDPAGRLVHVQFRRFAGCPVCNLHLRSFVLGADRLAAIGVQEMVFFHSSVDELLEHAADLPLPIVADPEKRWYRRFGVEQGKRAMLDPRSWPAILAGSARSLARLVTGRGRAPKLFPDGGRWGLPADFLVGPDGTVLAAHYGEHADDQWSLAEVVTLATAAAPATPTPETSKIGFGSGIRT
ncbi:peroxiredoxin-like family protein [Hamadaea tsunoensis]|uniref:peroxiredoxin-like family protein n=1 Tax=Hamadaea tsunoensis TaxID=53368 RepID=UPI0003FDDB8F|nr:peroxiredoxin-like family protein [Hamadaea tsunoensis]